MYGTRELETLRDDIALKQKKGLPFIMASVVIWGLITVVCLLGLPVLTRNFLVFCCSCPLLPLAWAAGKAMKVDIFDKENPLGKAGLLFTVNQMIYLLIVMWVYSAVPEKMVMVHAMVFGAHLLPYSWLYKSRAYIIFSIALPILALIVGLKCSALVLAVIMTAAEILFAAILFLEIGKMNS